MVSRQGLGQGQLLQAKAEYHARYYPSIFFLLLKLQGKEGSSDLQNPALNLLLGFEKKHKVCVLSTLKLQRPPSLELLPAVVIIP